MSRATSTELIETSEPTDLGAPSWIECRIVLDPHTAVLEAELPAESIPFGHPVRWRFGRRRADGSLGPLPAGWIPMLAFGRRESLSPEAIYGPFESLLQVVTEDAGGGVFLDLIGEWPRVEGGKDPAGEPPRPDEISFYAMLHRGLGFGSDRAFSLLSTAAQPLPVTTPDGHFYRPPEVPTEHRVNLTVRHEGGHRLTIDPEKPVKAYTNSAVCWRFESGFPSAYPLILFYHFKEMTDGAATIDRQGGNKYFEPHRKMRLLPSGVEAWDFKKDLRRHCFYEATVVSSEVLSLELVSTGDPQLDNEGTPFDLV